MSIFGIDFGNLKSRVAVTRRGGVDVILNEISSRDSSSYVSYGDRERFIGEKGFDQAIRNQSNTICNLKRFLGVRADSPALSYEKTFVPFKVNPTEDGEIEFEVRYKEEVTSFRPQQSMAALLSRLHSFVELDSINMGGPALKGTDCVLSCPVYYTMAQRKALLQSAQISGVNVMALLNEPTAAALDYGIFKCATFPDFEEGKPGTIVYFADLGHSATTITAVSFWKCSMKVLGCVYDTNLGTREIDNILLSYFREEILKKYKIDVFENKKARFRLLMALEKMKVMLSANPISNLNVECIMDDIDVSFQGVKRDDMEAMVQDKFFVPLNKLCERALSFEGVPAGTPVEIIGGGSRMPAVKSIIASVFKVTPGVTLVATETVAKGCAILAAMLSPKFKVREYNINDRVLWNISLGYKTENPSKPSSVSFLPDVNKVIPLFKVGDGYPKSLDLTFDRSEPFDLCLFYEENEDIKNRMGPTSALLNRVTVGSIQPPQLPTPSEAVGALKVRVRFRLSLTGIVDVEAAHVIQEYEVDEVVQSPPKDKKEKEGGKESTEETASTTVKKRKEKKSEATLESKVFLGMRPDSILSAKKLEAAMVASDALVFQTLEAKNALEGYMYDFAYKIAEGGELNSFVHPDNVKKFGELSKDIESWLNEEGFDSVKEEYEKRLTPMKDIGDKALARQRNADDLPLEKKKFSETIQKYMTKFGELSALSGDQSWHTPEELNSVKTKCEEALNWLSNTNAEYEKNAKYDEPVLTAALLQGRLSDVDRIVGPVLKKVKPAPPKPKEEPKPAAPNPSEEKSGQPVPPQGSDENKGNGMDVD